MHYCKCTLRISAMIAFANVLAACATNENQGGRSMFDPQATALERFGRSTATYQKCVSANEANPSKCEWQRNLMEADQRQLHASLEQK